MLQAPRQTLGVERVRARQPAGAGRVHRGHADAAGRVIVIVRRVREVPLALQLGTTLQALGAQLVNSVVDCAV